MADLDALLHPDYRGHPASGTRDRAGLEARIATFGQLFRPVRFVVEDQIESGDKLATRLRGEATRTADGATVTLIGLNISRFAGGRLIEEWMTWETAERG